MANEGEVPFNSLQVLSQARRITNSPLSKHNEDFSLNKNVSFTSFKRIQSAHSLCKSNENLELDLQLDYKSGAVYNGGLKDSHKYGNGTFVWPNGDKYVGEFKLNYRHGFGTQIWNDGSLYEGYFVEDRRSGHGKHNWKNGDVKLKLFF